MLKARSFLDKIGCINMHLTKKLCSKLEQGRQMNHPLKYIS